MILRNDELLVNKSLIRTYSQLDWPNILLIRITYRVKRREMNSITARNCVVLSHNLDYKLNLKYDSNKIMRKVILDFDRLGSIKLSKPIRLIKLNCS